MQKARLSNASDIGQSKADGMQRNLCGQKNDQRDLNALVD
ncbi:hypothetical protein PSP31121_00605 [Pandoraea sputorum]|uniref:Uncharacterized protein n=1 Tax=Pandoraea sputorum TaxID=93222 RepID=A0A5E5AQ03_9BURK|nr:hypothetical protein PSP31121_00605 [Pandoraea sputorum]